MQLCIPKIKHLKNKKDEKTLLKPTPLQKFSQRNLKKSNKHLVGTKKGCIFALPKTGY